MKLSWLKRLKNVILVEGLSWGFKKLIWKFRLVSDFIVIWYCFLYLIFDDLIVIIIGFYYYMCDISLYWMFVIVFCFGIVFLVLGVVDVF